MLAMRSLRLGSALRIGAMLTVISAATVLVACGDDPPPTSAPVTPTPATATSTPSIATPEPVSLPSQGPPSKWLDYYRLMAENPAGFKSMVEKNIETLSEDIKRDAANVDAYVKRGAAYVGLYTYWGVAEDVGSVELAIVDFSKAIELDPSNPESTDGRREDSGRGVRELQARWPGLHWGRWEGGGRSSVAAQGPYGRLRGLRCAGW